MVKNKKKQEDFDMDISLEDISLDKELSNFDSLDNIDDDILKDNSMSKMGRDDFEFGQSSPGSALQLVHEMNKESDTVKNYKEQIKEIRNSFLDTEDKLEVKHRARAYRYWKYIEKIIDLRTREDYHNQINRKKLTTIKSKEDFKKYLRSLNQDYNIRMVDDLSDEEVTALCTHIQTNITENYMLTMIEKENKSLNSLYEQYDIDNEIPSYIDDMDNLGKLTDTTIVSYGYKGQGASLAVTQVQAVKSDDIEKKVSEKNRFSFLDPIKKLVG